MGDNHASNVSLSFVNGDNHGSNCMIGHLTGDNHGHNCNINQCDGDNYGHNCNIEILRGDLYGVNCMVTFQRGGRAPTSTTKRETGGHRVISNVACYNEHISGDCVMGVRPRVLGTGVVKNPAKPKIVTLERVISDNLDIELEQEILHPVIVERPPQRQQAKAQIPRQDDVHRDKITPSGVSGDNIECLLCGDEKVHYGLICRKKDKEGNDIQTLCKVYYCETCLKASPPEACPNCRTEDFSVVAYVKNHKSK